MWLPADFWCKESFIFLLFLADWLIIAAAVTADLFQKLFRQDLLVASLFRNFLLAERIMRSYNCTPVSSPKLPPTFQHPMWSVLFLLYFLIVQIILILTLGLKLWHFDVSWRLHQNCLSTLLSYNRSCDQRKPCDRLESGEGDRPWIWLQDQMDQGGNCNPQMQRQLYESGHRILLFTVQLWQAPSPWTSTFSWKWHFTEKSRQTILMKASADIEMSEFLT